MDHDAMWTHVQKLMQFRDDLMVLNGHGMTLATMHKLADQVRAGKSVEEVMHEHRRPEYEQDRIKAGDIDDGEQFGTDKSDGAVKREGQELPPLETDKGEKEPAKDDTDAGKTLTATLEMEVPKTGEQTAVLGTAETHEAEKGTEATAEHKNAQAGSTEAATGV